MCVGGWGGWSLMLVGLPLKIPCWFRGVLVGGGLDLCLMGLLVRFDLVMMIVLRIYKRETMWRCL